MHYNVSVDDMNEGTLKYSKFGKVNLNNRVNLFHNDILQRAHLWARFHMRKCLDFMLAKALFHTCKSGEFYPNPTWVIPMQSIGMDI